MPFSVKKDYFSEIINQNGGVERRPGRVQDPAGEVCRGIAVSPSHLLQEPQRQGRLFKNRFFLHLFHDISRYFFTEMW